MKEYTTTPKTHYTALFDSFIENDLININDKVVFMAIKKFMNKDTFECFPSVDTICQCARLSKPTVLKSIENLESLGVLKVKRQRRKGNLYTVIDSFEIWLAETVEELKKLADKAYIEFLKCREIITKSVKVKRNATEQAKPEQKEQPKQAVEQLEQVEHEPKEQVKSIYSDCNFEGFSHNEQKKLIVLAKSRNMSVADFEKYLDYMREQRTKNKINNPAAYMKKLDDEKILVGLYRADGTPATTAYTKPIKNAFNNFEQREYDWEKLDLLLYNSSPVDCDRKTPLRKTIETTNETNFYNQMIQEAEIERYKRVSNFC